MFYNLKKIEQISIIFMCCIQKVGASKRMSTFLTSPHVYLLYFAITYGAKMIYFHTPLLYRPTVFIEKYIHELSERNSG